MFRKPKRKAKDTLRQKDKEDEDCQNHIPPEDSITAANGEPTNDSLRELRKQIQSSSSGEMLKSSQQRDQPTSSNDSNGKPTIMHAYKANSQAATEALSGLVTSTAEHHPDNKILEKADKPAPNDGIFRGDQVRNKFHAGPIRAAAHVRVTARFDYQPDICKDYKETGFCGFGDTCIYLHDRGDTVSGWQLEQQWEEEQKRKKAKQEQEMNDFAHGKLASNTTLTDGGMPLNASDDGIPFACHLCRGPFRDPVATHCAHYFCETCIMDHVRTVSDACPVCGKGTGSVFNLPTKLIAKKRKVLGAKLSKDTNSWQLYLDSFQQTSHKVEPED